MKRLRIRTKSDCNKSIATGADVDVVLVNEDGTEETLDNVTDLVIHCSACGPVTATLKMLVHSVNLQTVMAEELEEAERRLDEQDAIRMRGVYPDNRRVLTGLTLPSLDDDCPHTVVEPYGDGNFGRCAECNADDFPITIEAAGGDWDPYADEEETPVENPHRPTKKKE